MKTEREGRLVALRSEQPKGGPGSGGDGRETRGHAADQWAEWVRRTNPEGRGAGRLLMLAWAIAAVVLTVTPRITQAALPGALAVPEAPACAQTLPNLQPCILDAAHAAGRARDTAALTAVANQIRAKLRNDTGPGLYYRSYWLAFADYQLAQLGIWLKRPDLAKPAAAEARTLLDGLPTKDAESYALEYLVVMLQYPLSSRADMGELIGKTTELRGKLGDSASVRALLARAEGDYYTPKEFGGGRIAERLLRQALASPDPGRQPVKPTWGSDECAALLIRLLRGSNRLAEAKELYATWRARAPDSIAIGQLTGLD